MAIYQCRQCDQTVGLTKRGVMIVHGWFEGSLRSRCSYSGTNRYDTYAFVGKPTKYV